MGNRSFTYFRNEVNTMSLGERIMELRKAAGLSQLDLARAVEVSRQAVSKWETDQSNPDAANLIRLADLLDTEIEYLTTGRRTYGRRPPVVIKTTETIEKVVEKPVVQVVEKVVPSPPVIQTVEKPVVKKVYRTKYVRDPMAMALVGGVCFLLGLLIGYFL